MQIIQNIRDKGAAIVIAVIALSLIGFILMDAKQGSNRMFSGANSSVGKVNGQAIDNTAFAKRLKETEDQEEQQTGHAVSGDQVYELRENVWNQMVKENVLLSEFDKLGLTFSPKELVTILYSSEDAPAALRQAFTDKNTGQYDVAKVQQWWAEAKKSKGLQRESLESQIIDPIKMNALFVKYSSLIAASAYIPTWMKQKQNAENKTFASISYVAVPYNLINDSSEVVTDQDITDYLQKNKEKYKQDGGRKMAYVAFSGNPSATDTAKTLQSVSDLKSAFAATTTDTSAQLFLERNISTTDFSDAYTVKSNLSMLPKDSITTLPLGKVYGPYEDRGNFVLAKMLATRVLPDSVKCRHILIATVDPQSQQPTLDDSVAHKRADSIAAAIQGGADFNEMVLKYSDDPGSKDKKGEYTFTADQFTGLTREFAETIFYGKTGDKKVVHTQLGWHYIEVLDQKDFEPAYKIAYMSRQVLASDETTTAASTAATKLSGEAKDQQSFNAYVAKNGLTEINSNSVVGENDFQIGNLQDARQVVKWAFGAKEGEVSDAFSVGDQFVVAIVTKIVPEGLPDAATARPMVENIIRNNKKADEIIKKLGSSPTLQSASAAYGRPIATAGADSSLTFASQIINGVGQEPQLIGASFNKAYQTAVSAPIAGLNAVYVIKINSFGTKPDDAPEVAAQQALDQMRTLMQQKSYEWFDGLKKAATIKDERSKIY
ncbi:MAG TPA: peptidylprolyl isomerase [Ferruginibacter sp.]|jgi:peptidyl-prolyl cis-trans isomerase D|nr:peptidylprolyl isomerase [Ferruginibacter sp.]